jgi:hypothetical protein
MLARSGMQIEIEGVAAAPPSLIAQLEDTTTGETK